MFLWFATLSYCLKNMSRATQFHGSPFQMQLSDMFSLTALMAVLLLLSKIILRGEVAMWMTLAMASGIALTSWGISLSILTTLRVGRASKRFAFVLLFPLTILLGSSWFVQALSLTTHYVDGTSIGWWPVLGLGVQFVSIVAVRYGCDWVAAIDSDTMMAEPPKLFRR